MQEENISLFGFFKQYPDEESARKYFENLRWSEGVTCPSCSSTEVSEIKSHKPMPYRCRTCRKHFSVRTGSVFAESPIPLQKWLLALYLTISSRKGISSVQLAKHLDITQKSAWFLAQRIRESWLSANESDHEDSNGLPYEVDETFIGGIEKNKHANKKSYRGRGSVGKAVVLGAIQRNGKVVARHVDNTNARTLHQFINTSIPQGSTVYTDNFPGYNNLSGYTHDTVNHAAGEYVRDNAYTNNIESFWAIIKRAYKGVYHYISHKHLNRYLQEFSFRHNTAKMPVSRFIELTMQYMIGARLTYKDLVNG